MHQRRNLLGLILVSAAYLSVSLPGLSVGLWDPPELEVAEYARRIAVELLAASELSLEQAVNEVPTRRELGRGELPFTSIALGFKLFGLSEWAGRIPLLLWGALGVWATYGLVLRLATRRAACWAALVLCCCPLYFVHARTLLGDIVTMACLAIACAGLGVSFLDETLSRTRRLAWLAVGLLGAYAGFWCRGLLIGVAIPLVATSLTRLLCGFRLASGRVLSWGLDVVLLGGSALSFGLGVWALGQAELGADYSVLVGCSASHAQIPPSHDAVLHQLGHALFPASALLPFALGWLVSARPETDRRARLNLFVTVILLCALVVYSMLAPYAGVLPFAAVFGCAIAVGLWLSDFSQMRRQARAIGFGVSALFVLLLNDFLTRPETAFAAFAVYDTDFPAELLSLHRSVFGVVALPLLAFLFFGCLDAPASQHSHSWRPVYLSYLSALRTAFNGNLWLVLVFAVSALGLWALWVVLASYVPALAGLSPSWSLLRRVALNAWWLLLTSTFALPLLALVVRDTFRWLLHEGAWVARRSSLGGLPLTRGMLGMVSLGVLSGLLSIVYYPRLARAISPEAVFAAYELLSSGQQPLGSLAHAGGAAVYYTRARTHFLATPELAARWLEVSNERRFVVLRARDLPELNARYRRLVSPPANLPLVETSSSEVLLATNHREGNGYNPFDDIIRSRRPTLQHGVTANLGNRLEVIGWQLSDPTGARVDYLLPGREYQLSLAYEVIGSFEAEWDTFVHIDGYGRRLNADHPTLAGRYPLALLSRGDVIVDRHHVVVEPNFTPGDYQLYFGLYRGKKRLAVERGEHVSNRVRGGTVKIR